MTYVVSSTLGGHRFFRDWAGDREVHEARLAAAAVSLDSSSASTSRHDWAGKPWTTDNRSVRSAPHVELRLPSLVMFGHCAHGRATGLPALIPAARS
jgi:hypothetical protein